MPTLDWIGKDAVIRHHKDVPFRLLEADETLSHGLIDIDEDLGRVKTKFGGLWEEMSGGKCLFVMVTEKDWASIKEKI